jgi:hypothetical protein
MRRVSRQHHTPPKILVGDLPSQKPRHAAMEFDRYVLAYCGSNNCPALVLGEGLERVVLGLYEESDFSRSEDKPPPFTHVKVVNQYLIPTEVIRDDEASSHRVHDPVKHPHAVLDHRTQIRAEMNGHHGLGCNSQHHGHGEMRHRSRTHFHPRRRR